VSQKDDVKKRGNQIVITPLKIKEYPDETPTTITQSGRNECKDLM